MTKAAPIANPIRAHIWEIDAFGPTGTLIGEPVPTDQTITKAEWEALMETDREGFWCICIDAKQYGYHTAGVTTWASDTIPLRTRWISERVE